MGVVKVFIIMILMVNVFSDLTVSVWQNCKIECSDRRQTKLK